MMVSRKDVIAVKKMQMDHVLAVPTVHQDAALSLTGTAALNCIVLLQLLTVLRLIEGRSCGGWQLERNNQNVPR